MENNRTIYQRGYEEGGQEMMKRVREYLNQYKTKSDCCSQTVDDIYTNLSSLDTNNLKK